MWWSGDVKRRVLVDGQGSGRAAKYVQGVAVNGLDWWCGVCDCVGVDCWRRMST